MYLALSYLNQGDNAARPLTLMKRMVRLDPDRVLRTGFYPNKIANFYASARRDALDRLQSEGPTEQRGEALAERMDAQLVVFGTVVPRGDGNHQAKLFVYSAPDERFVEPEAVGISETTPEAYRAAGNRLISRITPCVYRETDTGGEGRVVESRGEGPLSIQLSFIYASYLTYPESDRIERPFGNLGLSVDARLLLTEEFGLRMGVGVMRSLLDYGGRIVEHLRTIRAQVGPDLGVEVGPFDVGLTVGLEGANVSPFAICKADVPAQEVGCEESNVSRYEDLDFLLGANVRPRVQLELFEAFDVTAGAGYTFFFVPFAEQPLNNPVSGHVGIKYRF